MKVNFQLPEEVAAQFEPNTIHPHFIERKVGEYDLRKISLAQAQSLVAKTGDKFLKAKGPAKPEKQQPPAPSSDKAQQQ